MIRPPLLLPARWAHASWLSPALVPGHERQLREASLQLLTAHPALMNPRARALRLPVGRPAFARLCRIAAACAAHGRVRQCVDARVRQQLARHIGPVTLDRLQRDVRLPMRHCGVGIDLADRFALTAQGLALYRHAYQNRPAAPWLPLRLPQALATIDPVTAGAEPRLARDCVAQALRLWRSRC